MSSKVNSLAEEIRQYYLEAQQVGNEWTFQERMLQIIDREKLMVLNRYRRNHGEPEIVPEPQRYTDANQMHTTWIIDVPKSWVSLVSKDGQS